MGRERKLLTIKSNLYLLGVMLLLVGCFGPWVDHNTAALSVTGFELAEFAKFFPQVQGGTVSIHRPLLYLPFVAALFLVAFSVGRSTLRFARLLIALAVAAVYILALVPFPVIDGARHALATGSSVVLDPQYTGQLALVGGAVGFVLTTLLARRLSRQGEGVAVVVAALAGIIPALCQFARLYPLIVALYATPLTLGWGLVASLLGGVLLVLYGVLCILSTPAPDLSDQYHSG